MEVMVRHAQGTLPPSEVFAWLLTFELLCEKGNSWKPCKLPDQKNPLTPFFLTRHILYSAFDIKITTDFACQY